MVFVLLNALVYIIVIVELYEAVVFGWLPGRWVKTGVHGDHDRAVKRLKLLLRLPAILGRPRKYTIRFYIADRLRCARRYDECVDVCQKLLDDTDGNPAFLLAPNLHLMMADSYDALKNARDAETERMRAFEAADRQPVTPLTLLTKGNIAERLNRYDLAYSVFERAYNELDGRHVSLRPVLIGKLAIAAFQSGRQVETIKWCELGLSNGASSSSAGVFHRMAGLSYGRLGELEKGLAHCRLAFEVGQRENKRRESAQSLACLSGIQRKMGRLDESLENGRKALAIQPDERSAKANIYETLMDLGRFDEARDVLVGSAAAGSLPLVHHEKRSSGVESLGCARAYGELGDFGAALDELEKVKDVYTDPKMASYCRAMEAWLRAGQGEREQAARLIDESVVAIKKLPELPANRRDSYAMLARAALEMRDFDAAYRFASDFANFEPVPCDVAKGCCLLGDALKGQGNLQGAKLAYEKGLAAGIETVWAKRIRERCAQLS